MKEYEMGTKTETIIIDENYDNLRKHHDDWYILESGINLVGDVVITVNLIIRGNVEIYGDLTAYGNQTVHGYQTVHGNQRIKGNQLIGGNQVVEGTQCIYGSQKIDGYQFIDGLQFIDSSQIVKGYQEVKDNQTVKGNQTIHGNQTVDGYKEVFGIQRVAGTMTILLHKTTFSVMMYQERYRVYFMSDIIKIGCKVHTVDEWKNLSDSDISAMDRGALYWWRRWKNFILSNHAELVKVHEKLKQKD